MFCLLNYDIVEIYGIKSASKNDILKMHLLVPKEKQSLDMNLAFFDCTEQKDRHWVYDKSWKIVDSY